MRKTVNTTKIEGRIYEHNLAIKTVQNQQSANYGKEYISGTIDIAVDEEGLNIVQNHFTFVTPVTSKGNANATFTNLKKIIDENKTWLSVGRDAAQMVSISTNLDVNDFYNRNDELVSAKRNEGGFVTLISALNPDVSKRTLFTADMVITNTQRIEANAAKEIPEYVAVRGYIFNFRNAILPVEFSSETPGGMDYFEGLGATNANPVFTQVWGTVNGFKSVTTKTEESAFGEPAVRQYETNRKVWSITGAHKETYDFGGDDLTVEELTKAIQDREVYLADVKKKNDEYKASQAASTPAPSASAFGAATAASNTVPAGQFNF